MDAEILKEKAALVALERVESGMRLGLGTGSTVRWFVHHLGAELAAGRLRNIVGVPTSDRTAAQCRELNIPLTSLGETARLQLAVDGADEIDPTRRLIKGLGGAMLREKMVAEAAERFVVVADASKLVNWLGTRSPVPVEVVSFAWESHLHFLRDLGADPVLRQMGEAPYRTDNGNYVLDCRFENGIPDACALARILDARPGVVEHGLFLDHCDEAILALEDEIHIF